MQDLIPIPLEGSKEAIPLVEPGFRVLAFAHPLKNEMVESSAPVGYSVAQVVEGLDYSKLAIWYNGEPLDQQLWETTYPRIADEIIIRAVPNKEVFRIALQIGIIVAATFFAGPAGLNLGKLASAAFIGGVTLAGQLVVNALLPLPNPKPPGPSEATEFTRLASITGARNNVGRFTPIPRLLGHMRYYPPIPMTGLPFTELVGDFQYLRALFILGYGPLDINGVTVDSSTLVTHRTHPDILAAIRIGTNVISNFEDVWVEIGDPMQMTLYSQSIIEDRVDVALNSLSQAAGQVVTDNISEVRTTQPGVTGISVDFEFPNGLFAVEADGKNAQAQVSLQIQYRPTGTADPWTDLNFDDNLFYWNSQRTTHSFDVTASEFVYVVPGRQRRTVRRGVFWQVPSGHYDVRVTRLQTSNGGTFLGSTDLTWLTLKSHLPTRPFSVPNVVAMALRIKATDELSGSIDNVSVEATSILPVWNGSTWVPTATSNPAWCYVEALCGVATRRPLDRDVHIDKQGMLDWAAASASMGMECNHVCEGNTTLFELIQSIASAGRASWALRNNLISVIREEAEQIPRQVFSPRNARNFRLQKLFPKVPHALRVQFIDPTTWQDTERLVFDDGYNEANATLFETLQLRMVTNPDQAWKLGRYYLAQMRLRPEIWTFEAHIDSLIAQRGDAAAINNDNFLNGLQAGRIKSVTRNGSNEVTSFVSDEFLIQLPDVEYSVSVRYIDAGGAPAIVTSKILNATPGSTTVQLTTPLPEQVQEGDLFTFGTVPTVPVKILRIEPSEDFSAVITAVPLAPEILDAPTGTIPAYDPLVDQPIDQNKLPPPTPEILRIRSDEKVMLRDADGSLKVQMVVDFFFPPGQPHTLVHMRYTDNSTPDFWKHVPAVSSDGGFIATSDVLEGETYTVQLRAQNANGLYSPWTAGTNHTVVGKSSPPTGVTGFVATVESFGILLSWTDIPDLDRDEYEIRTGPSWDAGAFFWRGAGTQLRTNVLAAGTHTFWIKSIDTSGNYSTSASQAQATITAPSVTGLSGTFATQDFIFSWSPLGGSFPIAEYEIRRGGTDFEDATFVSRVRTTAYRQRADWGGNETWRVAAIDIAGNIGTSGSITPNIALPTVQSVNPQVIDNTVLLRWVPIQGTLPIERYRVLKGPTFGSAEVIGVSDTTFSSIVESAGGTYTYWVLAIDSAGNEGPPQSVTTTVSQPPDYQLNDRFVSDGFGNRTNVQRISEDRRSVKFNGPGNDQFISLPNTLLDGETDCTIEVAVAFDAAPTTDPFCVFAAWNGAGTQSGDKMVFQFEAPNFTDNTITISFYPYNQVTRLEWVISGVNLYDGRFRMYSIRRNQTSGNVELFINGVSQGTRAGTLVTLDVAPNWFIFGSNINGNSATRLVVQTMNGRIDEIRVWRDLRTPTEILNYWNRELDLNEDNLAGYYRFNLQGNGVTADDDSPADNNGTINGASQNLPVPTLLVPFPASEAVQDKLSIHGYATPQAQITAGYDYVCQPVPLTASFEEVYNTGVVLAASRLQVLLDLTNVVGTVTAQVTISVKEQIGDPWNDFTPGETDVFATNFQFVKIHIDFTVGDNSHFATLGQITTDGFVKRKTDEGTAVISVNPTTIQFNVQFIDVESIVVTALGTTFALPVVDFTDVPFPTEFDVYLFDASGNPITGRTVKWVARGA